MKSQDTNKLSSPSPVMNLYEVTLGELKMDICSQDAEGAKEAIVEWLDRYTTDYTIKNFSYKGRAW